MTQHKLTDSGIQRKLTQLEKDQEALRLKTANRGRNLEDYGFILAMVFIAVRSLVELLQEVGILAKVSVGFPWGFWMFCGLLVLPKVIGRSSAGRFWEYIGGGIGRRIGGNKDAGES